MSATTEAAQLDHGAGWGVELHRFLGLGVSGKVYSAALKTPSAEAAEGNYAVKLIPYTNATSLRVNREADIALGLDHRNVVKTHKALPVVRRGRPHTALVMERCSGSLLDAVCREGPMPEDIARAAMAQILDGLEYLHSQGIAHRGLKPADILVAVDAAGYKTCKIADFGLAKRLEGPYHTPLLGDLSHAAPEQLTESGEHDHSVDIWPLGLILYTLLVGEEPAATDGVDLVRPASLSPAAREFIRRTRQTDPWERPSIDDLRHGDFMRGDTPSDPRPSAANFDFAAEE
mmetsp:Transcript_26944/g.83398  ORF Transcript_26944/g.83398 Transcript_26944/m.83398 type:complete len:289 (-) Transcript_26944:338-1204(-)